MINAMVSKIKSPVEFPNDVRMARTRQTPEEIPIPSMEKGLLLILLMMISAIT